jgi:hypothetical protein
MFFCSYSEKYAMEGLKKPLHHPPASSLRLLPAGRILRAGETSIE